LFQVTPNDAKETLDRFCSWQTILGEHLVDVSVLISR